MFTIKPLPEFTEWVAGLKDAAVRGSVVARVKRLALGLAGDVGPVGDGVSELRIHLGAGWRVYFVRHGQAVVVLLCGGSKRTQASDIKRAKALASRLA
ncbi:MAG TPA: type II toxin-antitoxin system RelE/ParE family toxin [Rubrivivax sp.]|nr:type II toxin-antitoxin system RelE/ParE family toxin [Rubrivivax sp.]